MEYIHSRNNNNKSNSQNQANTRIFDREMGDLNFHHRKINPINRLDIERDEFLKNSFINNDDDNNYTKKMPMRPNYNINTPVYEIENLQNKKSDFKNIDSYNPYSSFADIDADTKLSDNLQNNTACVNGINNYGLFLFDNMINIMDYAFVFSPYLIYSIFASLFIASSGNTEIELKNYFNFPRADILSSGLKDILTNTKDNNFINNCSNCIIFSNNIDYNQQFCNNINMFTKIRKINNNNYEKETNDINNIINKLSGLTKKSVSYENIKNCNIILLNYCNINPTWTSYFSKTIVENNMEFMLSFDQTFGFYEQPGLQVLELNSIEGFCFGIIYGDIELNDKNYKLITSKLKPTILSQVKIPKFKLQTKLRYSNLLKQTDLKTVFIDLKTPHLFSSQCEITDCLQNIELNISDKSIKSNNINGIKTSKNFIVDKSFRFYIRLASNNTIILLGTR